MGTFFTLSSFSDKALVDRTLDLALTPEDLRRLDEVSADRSIYPHWMIKRNNATRVPSGEPVKVGGPAPKN